MIAFASAFQTKGFGFWLWMSTKVLIDCWRSTSEWKTRA
jgi:hypothetical protein